MRTDVIVLLEPLIDDDLRLVDGREPLGIEHFTAQRSVLLMILKRNNSLLAG